MPKYCMGHAYTEKLVSVYLKLKTIWVSHILSANLILSESNVSSMWLPSRLLWQMIPGISLGEQIDKAQAKSKWIEI